MFLQKSVTSKIVQFCLFSLLSCGAMANEAGHHISQQKSIENALRYLSTYQELENNLAKIHKRPHRSIQVGPLINNAGNQGLIDIDIPLDKNLPVNIAVCDTGEKPPTIRKAVICTVNDGGRGNLDPSKIGHSTQGRELLAARLGNPAGSKVMVITQQHGNEPAGTEAAIQVIHWLSRSKRKLAKRILNELDILILVRANPDGGEPDAKNCAIDPAVGAVIAENCGLIRQNVDPSAGGGFTSNSEADFAGIVGRGYDLNRYHHVGLDQPIRPVENQAMVAAVLAFQPEVILDLHGDLHKTDCQIDYTSITPGQVLGLLPTAECREPGLKEDFRLLSPFADAQPNTEQEFIVQSLGVNLMKKTEQVFTGSVGRFSQVQLGSGNIGNGATGAYRQIGIAAGGWETVNSSLELRADVVAVVDGEPVISVNPGLPDPGLLKKQIRINFVALIEALKSLTEFATNPPIDGNGFCDYPYATGLFGNLPPRYWGAAATKGTLLIPIEPLIGLPLYKSGNCPDNPL